MKWHENNGTIMIICVFAFQHGLPLIVFFFLQLPHTALRLYGATEIRPLRGHVA